MNSKFLSNTAFSKVVVACLFSFLAVAVFFPNFLIFLVSFLSKNEETFVGLPTTLDNYRGLAEPVLLKLVLRSINISFWTAAFCLVLGYPFAYILARLPKKYRGLLLFMLMIPFWTSSLIRTYALIAIINVQGLLNSALLSLGLIGEPLQIMYTQPAVLIGMVYTLLPFMILPLFATLEKLNKSLLEAAKDLGAGWFQTFRHVILPLSKPGIIAGTMMVFLPSLSLFYVSDILGGTNSMVIGNLIRSRFIASRNWGSGAALSIVLTLFMIFFLWLYYRNSTAKERAEILA